MLGQVVTELLVVIDNAEARVPQVSRSLTELANLGRGPASQGPAARRGTRIAVGRCGGQRLERPASRGRQMDEGGGPGVAG